MSFSSLVPSSMSSMSRAHWHARGSLVCFGSFVVLASLGVSPRARADFGCASDAGDCMPSSGTGPCDDSCETGYCIGDRCFSLEDCPRPCDTGGGCPSITLGNHTAAAADVADGCEYSIAACPPFRLNDPTVPGALRRCFAGGDFTVASFVHGDCDGDQIENMAEGRGQICLQQTYVGPAPVTPIPTCDPTICPTSCTGGFPHGGLHCSGDRASAYACSDRGECPSTRERRATGCVPYGPGTDPLGACIYTDVCGPLEACFDLRASAAPGDGWLDAAYAAGDCDDDGVVNGADPADCGLELVVWSSDEPTQVPARRGCGAGALCTVGDCSRLDVCAPGGSIGIACDPDDTVSDSYCTVELGEEAECVEAGLDSAVGVCVPAEPADDSCERRGRLCFAADVDPADAYHEGDCDDDGLTNGEDPDVCAQTVTDAAVELDAAVAHDAATGGDGGRDMDASATGEDAGPGPDAQAPGRFQGSGCTCRAPVGPRDPASIGLGLLAIGLVIARRRGRR